MPNNYGLAEYYGNIDLNARKPYVNNGVVQTEHSFGFSPDGLHEILIPQVVNGIPLFRPAAKNHYKETGEHLGKFNIEKEMKDRGFKSKEDFYKWFSNYSNAIHNRQGERYR